MGSAAAYHAQTGKLTFLGTDTTSPIRVGKAMEGGLSPEARGFANLEMYAHEFGIQDVNTELSAMRSNTGEDRSRVRYQQMYNGIPVMAGELNVNMQADGSLLSINGETSPDLGLDTQPALDAGKAHRAAIQEVAKYYNLVPQDLTSTEPVLWIFDERLLQDNATQPVHLVWRLEVTSASAPLRELVLVNAETGRISLHFNQVDTAWAGELPLAPEPGLAPGRTANPVQEPVAVLPLNGQPEIALEAIRLTSIPVGSLYVSTNGSDLNDCLSAGSPCQTINAAIAKMTDGQTIAVAEGIYKEWVIFPYGTLSSNTLTGGWNETFTTQTGYATIDGENIRGGLICPSFQTLRLDHFIIQNGYNDQEWSGGGGITNDGVLTIQYSYIRNNKADGYGGGHPQHGRVRHIEHLQFDHRLQRRHQWWRYFRRQGHREKYHLCL